MGSTTRNCHFTNESYKTVIDLANYTTVLSWAYNRGNNQWWNVIDVTVPANTTVQIQNARTPWMYLTAEHGIATASTTPMIWIMEEVDKAPTSRRVRLKDPQTNKYISGSKHGYQLQLTTPDASDHLVWIFDIE